MSYKNITQDPNEPIILKRINNFLNEINSYKDKIDLDTSHMEENINELSFLLKDKEDKYSKLKHELNKSYNVFMPNNINNEDEITLKNEINEINNKLIIAKESLKKHKERDKDYKNIIEYSDNLIKDTINIYNDKRENDSIKSKEAGLNVLKAQESERQRIARDLHDSTIQNLTSLVHKTEYVVKLIDLDIVRAKLELLTMSNTINKTINDMRSIIFDFRPMSLDDLGLVVTIERFANDLMNNNNIKVYVKSNDEYNHILPVINLAIFRIVQEACNNVIKHAKASIINIDIDYKEKEIIVIINDNGIGFENNCENNLECDDLCGMGLSIMKERIYLLSGQIDIQSEINKGTKITIVVPIAIVKEDKNDKTY